MNRWGVGFVIALLWAVGTVITRSPSPDLLRDSDTKVMLQRIAERGNAWSWWTGDWPLQNHFYRPVVTETFELDLAVHGQNAHGYAVTNAILCGLCILALFWLMREVTGNVTLATGSASLFGFWHQLVNPPPPWIELVLYGGIALSGLALVAGLTLKKSPWLPAAFAMGSFALMTRELAGLEQFRGGMIDWVPGRTASTMTLFCLLAMAAYARYERTTAELAPFDPGPLDPPATRGSELRRKPRYPWVWIAAAGLSVFLALASYEQAVMLPALLIGVAIALKLQRYQVRWGWAGLFWGILVVYLALRSQVVPAGTSGYQAQQFRTGPGVYLSLADYVFPANRQIVSLSTGSDLGLINVLVAQYTDLLGLLANVVVVVGLIAWSRRQFARKDRTRVTAVLFGIAASLIAFLPMAWMKPFSSYNHYHYWPLALRTAYVMGLLWLTLEWLSAAWSPRALQAPKRLSPAPGSLPRP